MANPRQDQPRKANGGWPQRRPSQAIGARRYGQAQLVRRRCDEWIKAAQRQPCAENSGREAQVNRKRPGCWRCDVAMQGRNEMSDGCHSDTSVFGPFAWATQPYFTRGAFDPAIRC